MGDELQDLDAPAARRHALRRLAEVRGFIGDFQVPHRDIELVTTDGVRLDATVLHGPDRTDTPAVVLAHGFAAHRRKPSYAYLADTLSRVAHVLTLDLRGHGRSGGTSTLGHDEAYDIAAAVRWLRGEGHDRVVAVGVSMGGTSVAHAVGAGHAGVDAAVLVSAPGWLHDEPRTVPMAQLHAWWTVAWRRRLMQAATRARVVAPADWTRPPHPVDSVAQLDVPLLVVHGQDDPYFPVSEAEAIAASAPQGVLWLEPPGFGHAEDGFTPGFALALGRAVQIVADEQRFPRRDEIVPSGRGRVGLAGRGDVVPAEGDGEVPRVGAPGRGAMGPEVGG
ncbi:MAG TPA: alpha/beta fold hydrolase [Nitriliruptorales bacterium]